MENWVLWLTAIGSVVTALATVLLVYVGWKTLSGAKEQLVMLREQAEREGRPYITLQVIPGLHGIGSWDLVVENVGKTMARGVTLDLGDIQPYDDEDHIVGPLKEFAAHPRDIAPGERLRVMWRNTKGTIESGVSDTVTGRATYTDDQKNSFTETRELTTELSDAMPAPTTGPTNNDRDEPTTTLKNINHAIRALSGHLGELRR